MPEPVTPEVIAPEAPAAPEPAVAESNTISKAEHDAAMAKLRIEGKAGKDALAKLASMEAANLTEVQRLTKERDDANAGKESADARATKATTDALKASIGAELNIPPALRSRLTGTTEDEIRADATAVAADLKIEPPKKLAGGGGRPVADAAEDAFIAILNKP